MRLGRILVVSVSSLLVGYLVFFGGRGVFWRRVAFFFSDSYCMVFGYDSVIAGSFKEVILELGVEEEGY